jgi:hypothetical protein
LDVAALEGVQKEIQRVEWNRAIRAAARIAEDGWDWGTPQRLRAEATAKAIRKLVKPPLKRSRKPNTTA